MLLQIKNLRFFLKGSLSIMIWLSSLICSFSQEIRGRIISADGMPIPNSHIFIDHSTGTISNKEGYFKLLLPDIDEKVSIHISAIGYKPKEYDIGNIPYEIILQEDHMLLNEVVIVPRDFAREIIKKAIENIPYNYPLENHRLRGFLRERTYWKSATDKNALYIAESVIESSKQSYATKQVKGGVMIIEGRKYIGNGLDTLRSRIISGTHHPHRFDPVVARSAFIGNPKNYDFELVDTLRLNDNNLFKIDFRHKREYPEGSVFVQDSSYVIVKVDFLYKKNFPLRYIDTSRIFFEYSSTYKQNTDSRWVLSQTTYGTEFIKQKDTLVLESEYMTSGYEPDTSKIEYLKQVHLHDAFLNQIGTYDSSFWKDFIIILPDAQTEQLFRSQNTSHEIERKREKALGIIDVLNRMRTSLALEFIPIKTDPFQIRFANSQFIIEESQRRSNIYTLSLTSTLQYELTEGIFAGINTSVTLSKSSNSFTDLLLQQELNLNPSGRPIYFIPGIAFGYQQISKKIGNFKSESDYQINGKKFDSGSTDISLQQRGFRLRPSLTLSVEKSHRLQYFISADYNIPMNPKMGLYFDETDQFFFKQKSTFIENGKEGLTITSSKTVFQNRWGFSAGIYLSF